MEIKRYLIPITFGLFYLFYYYIWLFIYIIKYIFFLNTINAFHLFVQ